MRQSISFYNKDNQRLTGHLHTPKNFNTAIIILHGSFVHCDHPGIRSLAHILSAMDYLVLRFNFRGVHTSEGSNKDILLSKHAEDVRAAVDFLESQYEIDQLILLGHSSGAVVAALYADQDPRIDKVILLSGTARLKDIANVRFSKKQIDDFITRGYITYHAPGTWYHRRKLSKQFYDELLHLDVKEHLQHYYKPVLIVYGSEDEIIPASHAEELYQAAKGPKRLVMIEGANHRFSNLADSINVIREIRKFSNMMWKTANKSVKQWTK